MRLWILVSAICVLSGWLLSALRMLHMAGYLAVLLISLAVWSRELSQFAKQIRSRLWFYRKRYFHRFRRPLPLTFLILALLTFLGGVLYAPNNYDGLAYRFPRILHWWSQSGWHWIETPDMRMNYRPANFEWMMLPLLVFTKSDRLFFLLNWIPFLFFPGLIFSVFRQLGITARVAWSWMWILPTGYCYVMQAGSIGNDSVAVFYFLGALHFTLKARRSGRKEDVWWALLAATFLTGTKPSNLPLLLPVAFLLLPCFKLMVPHLVKSTGVLLIAAMVSILPTAVLNIRMTGDWAGDPTNSEQIRVANPVSGIIGNGLGFAIQNLAPPVFPGARKVEVWLTTHLPASIDQRLRRDFPRFQVLLGELAQEESAGLGLGIFLLLFASLICLFMHRPNWGQPGRTQDRRLGYFVGFLSWVACLVYAMKAGSEATARILAPYYPLLLLPFLLNPRNAGLVRIRAWNVFAIFCALSVLPALIATPSRPLFPVGPVTRALSGSSNPTMQHAGRVYEVYGRRNDVLSPLRDAIPSSVHEVGLIAGINDSEVALWRPFGDRRVIHLVGDDRFAPKMQWIVVKNSAFAGEEALNGWLRKTGGKIIKKIEIVSFVRAGKEEWSVVEM